MYTVRGTNDLTYSELGMYLRYTVQNNNESSNVYSFDSVSRVVMERVPIPASWPKVRSVILTSWTKMVWRRLVGWTSYPSRSGLGKWVIDILCLLPDLLLSHESSEEWSKGRVYDKDKEDIQNFSGTGSFVWPDEDKYSKKKKRYSRYTSFYFSFVLNIFRESGGRDENCWKILSGSENKHYCQRYLVENQ